MPMPNETDADRLAMIQAVDNTTVRFNGQQVSVIFDHDHELYGVGEGVGISGRQTMVTARTMDLPGIREGSEITVGVSDYLVVSHQPDGTGMTVLFLRVK